MLRRDDAVPHPVPAGPVCLAVKNSLVSPCSVCLLAKKDSVCLVSHPSCVTNSLTRAAHFTNWVVQQHLQLNYFFNKYFLMVR